MFATQPDSQDDCLQKGSLLLPGHWWHLDLGLRQMNETLLAGMPAAVQVVRHGKVSNSDSGSSFRQLVDELAQRWLSVWYLISSALTSMIMTNSLCRVER